MPARKHRLYLVNNDVPDGSQNLCEGCEKRRDVARFQCLEKGFQGGRLGAKRPVRKLWQQSSLHGTWWRSEPGQLSLG